MLSREIEYGRIRIYIGECDGERNIFRNRCTLQSVNKGGILNHLAQSKHNALAITCNLRAPCLPETFRNLPNPNRHLRGKLLSRPPNKTWFTV